jgi:hypothetical protein
MTEHERDDKGRCLVCLRNAEKQRLIRRAQKASDPEESRILLMQLEALS